jgi:hypothetical protein
MLWFFRAPYAKRIYRMLDIFEGIKRGLTILGFFDRIKTASGGRGPKKEDARTCERCKNHTSCKRMAMGNNHTCENYDEIA